MYHSLPLSENASALQAALDKVEARQQVHSEALLNQHLPPHLPGFKAWTTDAQAVGPAKCKRIPPIPTNPSKSMLEFWSSTSSPKTASPPNDDNSVASSVADFFSSSAKSLRQSLAGEDADRSNQMKLMWCWFQTWNRNIKLDQRVCTIGSGLCLLFSKCELWTKLAAMDQWSVASEDSRWSITALRPAFLQLQRKAHAQVSTKERHALSRMAATDSYHSTVR